eukprot:CAMPEP_0173224012 /NCGR_PEP_ID=MMETSP1142-20121109/4097_1 /TAXON_ID=483371 /ORGANISM="non described non described, Strain CCMP2298" /LENGTH=44 /DNA_ID= /DNA_START= /DNA_END= /DNA_ORIENTATION=
MKTTVARKNKPPNTPTTVTSRWYICNLAVCCKSARIRIVLVTDR